MGNLREFFLDLGRNAYSLGENVASLGSAAIAEPVAGYAAMYDPANGAAAIREGMTYQPRTEAGKMYQQGAAKTLGAMVKPAMPVIDAWQKGVDIAGRYSPVAGAALQTVPTALGVALGAKPAMQQGRQLSNSLGALQQRMIANASAPKTLNMGFRGQRGTFAGINALTADKEALAKAKAMIAQGVDPEDVWKETGWGRGADGKWRFEIDDSKINLHNKHTRDVYNISDAMDENDLLRAYPIIKDDFLAVGRNDRHLGDYTMGMISDSTTPNQKSISIRRELSNDGMIKTDELKSVLMHELQHAIQEREGFARGGNPEQFRGFYKDPYEAYRKLGGEVEARMVQNRMDLTPQQRRDIYPFAVGRYGYEDIPKSEQIFNYGNNKAMSQRPLTEFEQAHLTAQRNAALPVSQGGLGLAPDNTAMDRARAMGFDVDNPVYHGTGADFDAFDPNLLKETSQYMKGIFTTDNANIAGNYGEIVYPLVQKQGYTLKDKRLDKSKGITPKQIDTIRDKEKNIFVTNNPQNIRSRFAAFDPFNRDSSNLLAQYGAVAPTATLGAMMYNEQQRKKQGQ